MSTAAFLAWDAPPGVLWQLAGDAPVAPAPAGPIHAGSLNQPGRLTGNHSDGISAQIVRRSADDGPWPPAPTDVGRAVAEPGSSGFRNALAVCARTWLVDHAA